MRGTLLVVVVNVVSIKETVKELKDWVMNIPKKLGEADNRGHEHCNGERNGGIKQQLMKALQKCVEDLKNQSWRNNV